MQPTCVTRRRCHAHARCTASHSPSSPQQQPNRDCLFQPHYKCRVPLQRGQQKQPALQTAVDAIPKKKVRQQGRADEATRARELASMQCETGIRFELTDGRSQESQRRRQGQECNTKLQKLVMEGTMNVSNRTEQWFVIFSTFPLREAVQAATNCDSW